MKRTNRKMAIQKNEKLIIAAIILLLFVIGGACTFAYRKNQEYVIASENSYNMAFFQLVDYVENVETYLAKSLISSTPEHGAETLTHVWREADLAQSYLSQLPIQSVQLANTEKFLNQVSEYSFSLSRKNIDRQSLTQEDLDHLKQLHQYSVELENTLNQLSTDLNEGRIKWKDLTNSNTIDFAQQVSNISMDSFESMEENFHEYSGLIYDGAFSEHMTSIEKKGLTGEEIEEEKAEQIAKEFVGENRIKEIKKNGYSENATIPCYDFIIVLNEGENNVMISITKKGGHVLFANQDRNVEAETITQEQANEIGKRYLQEKGFPNMKETYYLKQNGIVTINYASVQNDIVLYPDLIKLKVALDNGEILGIETSGYLNSHTERKIEEVKISKEQAKVGLNKELEIQSENLVMIPTQWRTEVLCWEFKGKVEDKEFLVYINAQTGKEEDILVIINTPDGTLTH